jgi:hypothetical protein
MCCDEAYTGFHEILGEIPRVFVDCLVTMGWLRGVGDAMPGNVGNGLTSASARPCCRGPDSLRARGDKQRHSYSTRLPRWRRRRPLRRTGNTREVFDLRHAFFTRLSGRDSRLHRRVHSRTPGASASLAVIPHSGRFERLCAVDSHVGCMRAATVDLRRNAIRATRFKRMRREP